MKYLLFLILMILFLSCGSRKKVVNTDISDVVKEKIDCFIEENKKEVSSILDISSMDGKIVIVETEYDTSTPVDYITNKPKIKKETTTSIDFSKNDTTKTNSNIDTNINKKKTKDKEENINLNSVVEEEKKESTFFYYLYRCLFVFIIFVSVFIIYKVVRLH